MAEQEGPPRYLTGDEDPTETIDFGSLWPKEVTLTGSFDLQEGRLKAFAKLLNSLPIPAFLVDSAGLIMIANDASAILGIDTSTVPGKHFSGLFPYPNDGWQAVATVKQVYATRKNQVLELAMGVGENRLWGRLHFRSLRLEADRAILVLVEDLTLEKKQLMLNQRHQEELRAARNELEQRVEERTRELRAANEQLQKEILDRKRAEEHIRASLAEKEALLQEVHHRVKNNLQVVSSLLALQAAHLEDDRMTAILKDSQSRIRSMALIHEQLYQSQDLARIDFYEYLGSLASAILASYSEKAGSVSLRMRVDRVYLGVGTALTCGLIVNELVSNSLKHAFPGDRKGEICVELHQEDHDTYKLIVSDNGQGLPEGLDYRSSKSLGLRLVTRLAESQLNGTLAVRGGEGTEVVVAFRDQEASKLRSKQR
ncbi:MAG: hypothetical protein LDL33_02715 [Desulfomonile sp.]|nr:hypothetical protein [Desulfomonile sp.]